MAGRTDWKSNAAFEKRRRTLARTIAAEVNRFRTEAGDHEHEAGLKRALLLEAQSRALRVAARGR